MNWCEMMWRRRLQKATTNWLHNWMIHQKKNARTRKEDHRQLNRPTNERWGNKEKSEWTQRQRTNFVKTVSKWAHCARSLCYNNARVCVFEPQSIGVKRARIQSDSTIACYATHLIEFESIAHIYIERMRHWVSMNKRNGWAKRTTKYFTCLYTQLSEFYRPIWVRTLRILFRPLANIELSLFPSIYRSVLVSCMCNRNNSPNGLWEKQRERAKGRQTFCERFQFGIYLHIKKIRFRSNLDAYHTILKNELDFMVPNCLCATHKESHTQMSDK